MDAIAQFTALGPTLAGVVGGIEPADLDLPTPCTELDVRGRSAQEAREAVRSLVDDASLGGLPSVRIVHGRGTGALRTAVRDELRKHPLVLEIAAEAADGATVGRLSD